MKTTTPLRGTWQFFWLTLRLNLRSGRALAYGFLMPVLFLIAFASVFRADSPPLRAQLGQILTITILGGACFGFPTALVAERERGVWRRYRLLPVSPGLLVGVLMAARIVLVVAAVALQLVLARALYGTPWPAHPLGCLAAVVAVTTAFLGLGLLIAALADDVPAVQALGQCVFLPMILIGGVGVPLLALPEWARIVAAFMPGRYAVEILQRTLESGVASRGAGFDYLALAVIGGAAAAVGWRWLRWEAGTRRAVALPWIALALLSWVLVGGWATGLGRTTPLSTNAYAELTDADLEGIRYDDLPGDNELVTRLAPPFAGPRPARIEALAASLQTWAPARTGDVAEDVRNLVAVAAIADIGADPQEAEIARMVFDELGARYRHARLRRALAWIVLHPQEGRTVRQVPELDLQRGAPPEKVVRERTALYAKKYLGRLTGHITAP